MEVDKRDELTNLLRFYLSEEADLSKEIAQTGRIPEKTTKQAHCSNLKYLEDLSKDQMQLVEAFLNWVNEAGIEALDLRLVGSENPDEQVAIQVNNSRKGDSQPYRVSLPTDPDVHLFFSELHPRSKSLPMCNHLSTDDGKEALLENARLLIKKREAGVTQRGNIGLKTYTEDDPEYRERKSVSFACDDCVEEENRARCDCLSFDGVIYNDQSCYWRRGLFKQIAEEHELEVRDLGSSDGYRSYFTFFLPQLDALVTKRRLDDTEFLDKVDPNVTLGSPCSLVC